MSKKITMFGMYIALAFIFSYIEGIMTLNIGIPGIKLGLANLVVVTVLYSNDSRTAVIVSIVRIILCAFIFSNMMALIYSMAGGVISLIVMILMKRANVFSIKGVSIAGGVTHNVAQIAVAALMFKSSGILGYIPVLLVAGMVTGMIIGMLGANIVPRIIKIVNK